MERKIKGFTLLEILLVLVIAATILGLFLNYTTLTTDQFRRNKEAMQVQQILNAALSYYIQYGTWPGSTNGQWTCLDSNHDLLAKSFLPAGKGSSTASCTGTGVWLGSYSTAFSTGFDTKNFYVINQLPAATATPANSLIIAGMLPLGTTATVMGITPPVSSVACAATGNCYVSGGVAPPGQSLNNARSVNFAGVYHHGACVPAPVCPTGTSPTIFVVPISVSGVSYAGNTNTYPITSFTAYAYGTVGNLSTPAVYGTANPASCGNSGSALACTNTGPGVSPSPVGTITTGTSYWRVCMQVQTPNGVVSTTNTGSGASAWGQYASVAAFTRCTPTNEPFGSDISVFTQ